MSNPNREDLEALISYAHRGCIETIVEAERRLLLLERFGEDAILYPALHTFDKSCRAESLAADHMIEKLNNTIAEAKRIGELCEKWKNAKIAHDLEGVFDFLRARHSPGATKKGKSKP
jgi:hypothetical protein